jgi:penicillin-binding protein 1C
MKRSHAILSAFGGVVALCAIACGAWVYSLGPVPLGQDLDYSRIVLDRNGKLLRAYADKEGRWRLPATPDDVDQRYLKMLFAYEDKRFYAHDGVDVLALVRAAYQLVSERHIVSGGSTLTMQVARLLEPRRRRSFYAKLRQITRALQIEENLSKNKILSLYLTLAPYGGNLEGIRSASLAYFGKEPKKLTVAQAALLVALPQAPEARRPDRYPGEALAARNLVLDRVADAGAIPQDEVKLAKRQPVPQGRRELPALAPNVADEVVSSDPNVRVHRLTIDAELQKTLEQLARDRARALGPRISIGIVTVDNATNEVRARVASADYFDAARSGQVDMTQALRSPGSTLKPFIYGLGFEDGLIHPETLIDDRPVRYGNYTPENFDLTFQGTVTVRRALQFSLNVPAIAVLDKVGVNRLAARLTETGVGLVLPQGEAPGLAMGLGGVGIKLADLTMLYAGLARLGETAPLIERQGQTAAGAGHRLLDPVAAWYVGNILIGAPPPDNAPGGRIAFKTGTSYGYRDAWAVGFDGRTTIGVWVGRPDGAPVPGLVGRASAAPILFDAFARTGLVPAPQPHPPKGVLFSTSARLPPPLRRFVPAAMAAMKGDTPRIMFPPNGARLELAGSAADGLPLKFTGGRGPLTVMVNGMPLHPRAGRHTLFFHPDGPGFVRLTVMDRRGAADTVTVRLQ